MVKKKIKKKKRSSPAKKSKKKSSAQSKKKKVVGKKAKKQKTKVKKQKGKKLKPEGQLIGSITHYFPHVQAAVLVVKKGGLKVGDKILVKGHTTRFEQPVTSMQVEHVAIAEAKKGDEIGLQVIERVREHDEVYKIK